MTPTPQGEGKTTTTIGLADALRFLGHRSMFAVREPSLGPYFGIKGGGTGAGRAQVVPAEDINLHFVGDMYAVEKANNLLSAMVDNHLQHGNELGLDPRRIVLRGSSTLTTVRCATFSSAWAASCTACPARRI